MTEDNYKPHKKLPERIVRKWNRIVVEELDESGDYPSFKRFAEFLRKESKIACNLLTSSLLMSSKVSDERLPKRAKALNTRAQVKGSTLKRPELQSTQSCSVCRNETHHIAKCPDFAAKSTDDKRLFIRENHLCFGCLRKGHITKDDTPVAHAACAIKPAYMKNVTKCP
ncbi:uncharacterized protein LOC108183667 [Tachysurus ichikawai]